MLTDDSIMSFGKYAGEKMANVPATYLLWLDEQWKENPPRNKDGRDVWQYINNNREVLETETKSEKWGG